LKIGYRTISLQDRPIEEAIQVIAEAGYDSVELCLENPDLNPLELTPERVRALVAQMNDQGVTLGAISYHGVEDQLEERRLRTYAAIDLLPEFGADVLVVASRREEPARLHAQWEEAVQLYCELANRCADHGAKLAVEPQPGLVVRNAEDLVKILRACDHPNLGANLDIAHAIVTADDLSWAIFQLGSRLVHVHLADVRGGTHEHLVPGRGEVDFGEVHDILESVDYDRCLVLDIPRPHGDPAAVCREALLAFRELWPA
jgi:sugar phosphate isomerase/epimerase